MTRRLLDLLAALSLLLCVAACVLWSVSYWRVVGVSRYSRPYDGSPLHTHEVNAFGGRVLFAVSEWGRGGPRRVSYCARCLAPGEYTVDDVERTVLGFGHSFALTPPDMVGSHFRVVSVPCWALAALPACAAALCFRSRGHPVRLAAGRCRQCGYDLTGNVSGVCPECGHAR
jgi:hypothetical protein